MKSLAPNTDLESLGSLFFDPLWIFYRKDLALRRIPDLKGLRLAVGEEGSGTKILTMHLLKLNGVNFQNTRILSDGYQKAAEMLLNAEVDVAFFVSTHRAAQVLKLIDSKSVKLMGLDRAEAYALLYHYLYVLKVPEGVIDFAANIPARDLTLVAPTTQLLARPDLHPALISLLLEAAKAVHKFGGDFEREGEFPTPKYLDIKLNAEAERFYKSGPPFLQRYLPFWIAIFVSRMAILLLPLVAVFLPLFKLMPPIYRWRIRSKIYRWYSKLRALDPERHKQEATERLQEYLVKLDGIEGKRQHLAQTTEYGQSTGDAGKLYRKYEPRLRYVDEGPSPKLENAGILSLGIRPLLAGAGVIGLAIGFSALILVKDIIAGIFLLIEDAFRIGDYMETGGQKGTVEHISLRSLRLRNPRGPVHTIPFGRMGAVTNMSRDYIITKLDFRVHYDRNAKTTQKTIG